MEITDSAQEPLEIIELGEMPGLELIDQPMAIILPGSDVPMTSDPEEVEEEQKETDWENDGDHNQFMSYLRQRLDNIPRHSGSTTVGCEKAMAFLKRLDREISKAIQSDEDNIISEDEAEGFRDQIHDFISQLDDAHEKLMSGKRSKKKASVAIGKTVIARLGDGHDFKYYIPVVRDDVEELLEVKIAEPNDEAVQKFVEGEQIVSLKKEGSSARIVLYVDPFMQGITRMLIDGHVSAGHNMEIMFANFKKKYNLTDREKLGIQEILLQKGFPIYKDLGLDGEEADLTKENGVEFSAGYPG